MKIFFENYADDLFVDTEFSLNGSLEQAIDIFHNLPDYDGSYIGFVNKSGKIVEISKYDRFLFLIEIPIYNQQASYFTLFTYFQTKQLIIDLYNEFDPYMIESLRYTNYLDDKILKGR